MANYRAARALMGKKKSSAKKGAKKSAVKKAKPKEWRWLLLHFHDECHEAVGNYFLMPINLHRATFEFGGIV